MPNRYGMGKPRGGLPRDEWFYPKRERQDSGSENRDRCEAQAEQPSDRMPPSHYAFLPQLPRFLADPALERSVYTAWV
jgi:hypothetical protein